MNIPIQNIYYLLSYAWNQLEESRIVSVNTVTCDTLVDLFAKVLVNGMSYILRRGLDRGYVPHYEKTGTLRGKIDFTNTVKKNYFSTPQVYCEYDELEYNLLHNQIIKTTLFNLIRFKELDSSIRDELLVMYHKLKEVELISLEKRHFGLVQLHSNNAFYEFLLNVCEIMYDNLIPAEKEGTFTFRDFVRDEQKMATLFEAFVRNFYKREQTTFTVGRENILWEATALDEHSHRYLPKMQTDVSLTSPTRKIIIDTKYYTKTLQSYYEKESIRSAHLYQIHAYMTNLPQDEKKQLACEAILLYPKVEEELNIQFRYPGYQLRIKTIDLNQADWRNIGRDLLKMIGVS